MLVFLPSEKDGLNRIEQALSTDRLASWRRQLKEREVIIHIPKFTMSWGCQLEKTLRGLGMESAFAESADFSGMKEANTGLHIDAVVHQAFIEMNEEGTEAAAVSDVSVKFDRDAPTPPPEPVFRADHPFPILDPGQPRRQHPFSRSRD